MIIFNFVALKKEVYKMVLEASDISGWHFAEKRKRDSLFGKSLH